MKPSSTGSVGQAQVQHARLAQQQDDREDHRRGADDGGADEHGLGGRLEGVAGRVVGLEVMLAAARSRASKPKSRLDFLLDAGDVFGLGQLEDRLGIVGHRAVAIDGDVDRAHAQEAERDQAEREDGAD